MKEELQKKIKKVKGLVREITQDPEFRKACETKAKKMKMEGKEVVRGTCFNGCAACLPCLATPTPDLEIMVGFTITEFY